MYDAVLFDLDGTLVDTERLAQAAGHAAFVTLGYDVDPKLMQSLVGKDAAASDQIILSHLPEIDLAALIRAWDAAFEAALGHHLPLRPGAKELLNAFTLPRALATSSGRESALRKLAMTGLASLFDAVVVREDVTNPKPAPEPFLLAAQRLGVSPTRCLVFEDSDTGAEAAHRAGCTVVQVPDTQHTTGPFAHFLAPDLMTGARMAGLF